MAAEARSTGAGRLTSVLAWTVLLLALWVWGKDLTGGEGSHGVLADGTRGQLSDGRLLPPPLEPLGGSATPLRVEIASIGVRADIIPRGVDADGGVEPPPYEAPDIAGWYRGGPSPGAEGAALLVGHVDTETDRAVFYNLSSMEPGGEVTVVRSDGSTATFTVEAVEVIDRDDFDPDAVYGAHDARRAELRLITCGGTFDPDRRSYSANVVVSAYLTATGDVDDAATYQA
ncbi:MULTISPECIES: class F sortase [Streptomyces]|uniref:class F sortase n=1 Tax=Streptomyces TaxID=1883 RepID=UPI000CD5AC33|nr:MULTISPECIES: class F sortase [Streptomyces]